MQTFYPQPARGILAACESVTAFGVFELFDDGFGGHVLPAGAEVPLEVADPEDELGDGGGARIDFDPKELVGIDAELFHFEVELAIAVFFEFEVDFAFEALHVLEGDVEEIAGAAGGVENFDLAELWCQSRISWMALSTLRAQA
jgi:hypothetical protein